MVAESRFLAITVIFILFLMHLCYSGDYSFKNDRAFLYSLSNEKIHAQQEKQEAMLPQNEISDLKIVSFFLIRLYQKFISSQQNNVCVFYPSCSHYGAESIQRFGFFYGVLLTADRMERCNQFAQYYGYRYDPAKNKLIDPVVTFPLDDFYNNKH